MSTRVNISIDQHIANVVLCRPEKYNALDQQAFDQLAAAGVALKQDKSVRAIVISAEGDNFCAGADKNFLQGAVSDNAIFKARALSLDDGQIANEFQKPAMVWTEQPVPVIACLQGITYGAGCQIALAADFRIASPTVQMSLFEIHWGLIPDMGVTQTLTRLLRDDVAKEMVMTGRVVEADEALSIGLVTRVVEDALQQAQALAQTLAGFSPDAVQRGKQLLDQSRGLTNADALQLEARLQAELVGGVNQQEAVLANLQKRTPEFR